MMDRQYMKKSLYVFMVVLAMLAVVYILIFAWGQHSDVHVFSDAWHSAVYSSSIGAAPEGPQRQYDTPTEERDRKGFSAGKEARKDSSLTGSLSINTNDSAGKTPDTNVSLVKTLSPDRDFSEAKTVSPDRDSSRGAVSKGTGSQKYLIYLCRGGGSCGGWADRQRGLASAYFLALVIGRKFGMIMDKPCSITHFYVPNDVSWVIPAAELEHKAFAVINDMGSKSNLSKIISTSDFNEYYPQDVVYLKTNNARYDNALAKNKRYAPSFPKWAKSAPKNLVFARIWKTLARPSHYLQHLLDDFLESLSFQQRTQPLVCCHVRIGKSNTLKSDQRARMKVSDVSALWEFLDSYVQNGSQVFLATDNLEVRNLSRQRFGKSVWDTGGNIVHVDRFKGVKDACEGFGYAVLDQLILTKCDVLVLTPSGFGKRAAFIRGVNKNVFEFSRNKVKAIKIW